MNPPKSNLLTFIILFANVTAITMFAAWMQNQPTTIIGILLHAFPIFFALYIDLIFLVLPLWRVK